MREQFGVGIHCHHNVLVEVIEGLTERETYIRESKPAREQGLRLRLIAIFPDERLPLELQPLVAAARDAWAKRKPLEDGYEAKVKPFEDDYEAKVKLLDDDYEAKRKPLDDDYRAKRKPLEDAYRAKRKALADAYEAKRKALDEDYRAKCKALDEAMARFMPQLVALHAELCPDCPWDGHTIFSKKEAGA
mgnify:CR=1 FL=1